MIDIDISDTDVYTDIDMDIDKDMILLRNYTLLCNNNSQHIKLNTLSYFGSFNLSTRKIFLEIKPVLSNGVKVPISIIIKDINCDTKLLHKIYAFQWTWLIFCALLLRFIRSSQNKECQNP